jgi:hypothetical protein
MEAPGDAAWKGPRCRRGSDGSEGDTALSEGKARGVKMGVAAKDWSARRSLPPVTR